MASKNTPRTSAATAARLRIGQETMAEKLRAAGWTCVPPSECGPTLDGFNRTYVDRPNVEAVRRHYGR